MQVIFSPVGASFTNYAMNDYHLPTALVVHSADKFNTKVQSFNCFNLNE